MTLGPVRALLLLIALLSAGLASLWIDPQGHWRHLTWLPPAAVLPDVKPPLALTTLLGNDSPPSYASILERPVFAPDRRPPPPPAPPPPPDPLADIQLFGIFSGTNPGVLARVEGKMRRVTLNQTLGAWTLTHIDGRTATFAKGDEKRELKLAYAPLGARTPPPGQPAAQTATDQPAANRAATPSIPAATQNQQDQARETLRRRNEIRAAKGLPLITQ